MVEVMGEVEEFCGEGDPSVLNEVEDLVFPWLRDGLTVGWC